MKKARLLLSRARIRARGSLSVVECTFREPGFRSQSFPCEAAFNSSIVVVNSLPGDIKRAATPLAHILQWKVAIMRMLFILFIALSPILLGQPDARQIAERSIGVADRDWTARQSYTYVECDEERHLDSEGRMKSTDVRVSRAFFVNGDTINQAVSHNGGPPTPEQKKKDQELLRKRRSETLQERTARLQEEKENRAFLGEVANAFNFRLLGEQAIDGRPAYILEATPKSAYRVHSKYGKMFSKVRGKLWVDKQDFGWVKVDANVVAPFSMGLFLARVQPGTHIAFEQTRMAEGIWLPKRIEIKAAAKILFLKNYQMQEVITFSEYRPAQPSEVIAGRTEALSSRISGVGQ